MKDNTSSRIDAQFAFLTEADRLKSVLRATKLCDGSRFENTGEHSWHVALYALVMAEHAVKPVNIDRVIKMILIHDLVEIDAGDTPIHSQVLSPFSARPNYATDHALRIQVNTHGMLRCMPW